MVQETYTGAMLDQNTKMDLLNLAIRVFADYFSDYFHCQGDREFESLMHCSDSDVNKTNKNLTRLVEVISRTCSTRTTDKRINRKIHEAKSILNCLKDADSVESQVLALQGIDNAMIKARKEQGWGFPLPRMFMHNVIGYSKFHEKLKIIHVHIFKKNTKQIAEFEFELTKELEQKKEIRKQQDQKYSELMKEYDAKMEPIRTELVMSEKKLEADDRWARECAESHNKYNHDSSRLKEKLEELKNSFHTEMTRTYNTPEILKIDSDRVNTKNRIDYIEGMLKTIKKQVKKSESYIFASELPSRSLGR